MFDQEATSLAAAIARGETCSEAVVLHYLDRIRRRDPHVHAFVSVFEHRALTRARQIDRELRRGKHDSLPPFLGVPVGVKDLNFVRGAITRMGSAAFGPIWSPIDDRIVRRLRRAGFVIVGKLATSELGAMPVTEPAIHPPTKNPYNLAYAPGGSSGGSAAAVAAGLLPIAHANDAAGSIRIPAAFCGLFGFKPSFGVVPNAYSMHTRHVLHVDGCIGRSMRDVAAFTRVLALPGRLSEPRTGRLKVRFSVTTPLAETHPDHSAAVERVAEVLAALGHDVERAAIFARGVREIVTMYQHLIAGIPLVRSSKLQPVTRWLRESGEGLTTEHTERLRAALAKRIAAWFGDVDIWITPTVAMPPPKIGAWLRLSPEAQFAEATRLAVYTAGINVTGQPAGSIPVGRSTVGLPIGVQLVGRIGDDATVLNLMSQVAARTEPLASVVIPADNAPQRAVVPAARAAVA